MATQFTTNSNLYKWQSTDTKQTTITEMANNMDKLDASLAQIAHIVVNVEQYATSGATDYSQALNSAIAALPNGGEIRFPAGTFIVNNVSIPTKIRIKGAGKDATIIQRNANNSVFVIVGTPLPNGGNPSHYNNGFEDLTVTSNGDFASDLVSVQGVTGMNINRVKFYANGCRLLFTNQMWDSRITNCQFFNGGKSDGTPAVELASGLNGYNSTKETVLEGCHFESYSGSAIRTQRDSATNFKTAMMSFSNLKFESVNCTGNHLNLEANNLLFSNVYITTEFTTTDVIKMTACRGVLGNIAFFYVTGVTGATIPQSLINIDASGYLIHLNVLVEEPQPNNANVATIDSSATKVFLNITANQILINNVLTSMTKMGAGALWLDSKGKPRISSTVPSYTALDTSGFVVGRFMSGNTAGRPSTGLTTGDAGLVQYFDTTVNKNLVWNGSSFRDAFNCMPENVGINAAVIASATSLAVTLPTAEASASYAVSISPTWNTTYWITNKLNTGFTINFGTAPASASTLDWSIKK